MLSESIWHKKITEGFSPDPLWLVFLQCRKKIKKTNKKTVSVVSAHRNPEYYCLANAQLKFWAIADLYRQNFASTVKFKFVNKKQTVKYLNVANCFCFLKYVSTENL